MAKTPQGHIRKRGNRYEVAVFQGRDPITKRNRYVYESAKTHEEAERQRDRLLERVAQGREADTKATVGLLLDQWLSVADLAVSTRHVYEGFIERTIRPAVGDIKLRTLQHRVDILDKFYAHLRRCRLLCDGRPGIDHRTSGKHECDERCRPHACRPMQPRTIRNVHAILRAALGFAVKWGWIERNPAEHASPPKLTPSEINPPDPEQAARLVDAAWEADPNLGVFLWLAMTTGARRAELCVLRWSDIRFDAADLLIARAFVTRKGQKLVKDTKTHQKRRLSLDPATVQILEEHQKRQQKVADQAGLEVAADGYVFSRDGFGEDPWLPDTLTHQFRRIARQVGVPCRLHDLRHYSATQMIANGVDLRTVAGRLGHSGGGAITLKVYSHWTRPAEQHAAELLSRQLRRSGQ